MTAGIEVQSVTAMGAAQSHGERVWLLGYRHKVNMVTHQAIGKSAKARLCAVGLETFQVSAAIGISEKTRCWSTPRCVTWCATPTATARANPPIYLEMCFVG
jgi:hypothetical protein